MSVRKLLLGLAGAGMTVVVGLTALPALAADNPSVEPTTNIIGGQDATRNYPFSARVLAEYPGVGTSVCSAAFVTVRGKKGVALNAHCLTTDDAQPLPAANITVQYGSVDANKLISVTAARVEVMPDWDWATDGNADAVDDGAVLALPPGTYPAGIPVGAYADAGRNVRLLGWGLTALDATELPGTLQQLDTTITNPDACAAALISEGEICVAPAASGGQAYFGDGGGPALARHGAGWRLLGGTSRATTATMGTGPTVFIDWTTPKHQAFLAKALDGPCPKVQRHVALDAAQRFKRRVR